MIAAILVMLASLLGCSIAVEAHQINLTNARIVISPDRIVEVEIAIKGSDADRVAGTRVFDDATGLVRPAALTAASAIIVAYVEGIRPCWARMVSRAGRAPPAGRRRPSNFHLPVVSSVSRPRL